MFITYRITFLLFAITVMVTSLQAAPNLPDNLEWLTNNTDPAFSSPNAVKGGTLNSFFLSFPPTLRYVGPDSNGGFHRLILGNMMSLVETHPNTSRLVPSLATHWAFSDDNKTMYFKLNPLARWSDDKPVSAEDYAFTLEFMRSKDIIDPVYNSFFTEEIESVDIYDNHTISVSSTEPRSRNVLHTFISLFPTPRHFYEDMSGFVKKYNWNVAPNTGPYQVSEIKKGKSITFKRKKDWWASKLKYYKNRFNVDKVKYTVFRDINLAFEHFKKGNLDVFELTLPQYWHEKAKGEIFDNGYAHKLWFYSEPEKYANGLWLNQENPILKDRNVRLGIAYSMNIDKVNQQVLRGDYSRQQAYASAYSEYTDRSIKARPFDLEKANEYFGRAGWVDWGDDGIRVKNGKRLSLSVTYGHDHHTPRLAVLKEEFKKAGLELILRKLEHSISYKSALENKHEIWWGSLGGISVPLYEYIYHSRHAHKPQTNNFTNTDDPEMDRFIEAYLSAMNPDELINISRKLENLIHQHSAFIPTLEVPYKRVGYWRWIQMPQIPGTKVSGPAKLFGTDNSGGLFWIDQKLKKETIEAKKTGKTFPAVTRIDTTFKVVD